jgi:hypothetical protein
MLPSPSQLAVIDRAEEQKLAAPPLEVYVGFHELEGLLPLPPTALATATTAATATEAAACPEPVYDSDESDGPWGVCPELPKHLEEELGQEGCRELRKECAFLPWQKEYSLEEIYRMKLPRMIKKLLDDRARDAVRSTTTESELDDSQADNFMLRAELEAARLQLLLANTSLSTLQGVIRDHRCTVHRSD